MHDSEKNYALLQGAWINLQNVPCYNKRSFSIHYFNVHKRVRLKMKQTIAGQYVLM